MIATALAVKALRYPNKKIYICDDGQREELKEMAERFSIGYLSREGNEHAKAGNINYALSQTTSDLVLLLDADFIVKKISFLKPLIISKILKWHSFNILKPSIIKIHFSF